MTYQRGGSGCIALGGVGIPEPGDSEAANDDDCLTDTNVKTSTEFVGSQAPDDQGQQVDTAGCTQPLGVGLAGRVTHEMIRLPRKGSARPAREKKSDVVS